MAKINGGATIWARQTIDSEIFYNKPDKWFKIWFYLVNKANHKDNKQFKRSSCFMKYEWIMEKTKASRSEVDHCIRWLKSARQIATQKAIRGFILEVLNYDKFQRLKHYKSDAKSDAIGEVKAKQKRHKSDTINKNDKNDKNTTKQEEKINFNFSSEDWENIVNKDRERWIEAYPACDIKIELAQMAEWLLSNPDKRKKNYRRFITNWLARSQEKGGTKGVSKKSERQRQMLNLLEEAQKDLTLHPSKNRVLSWLNRLPKEYHSELQKYEYYWEAKNKWEEERKKKCHIIKV